MIKTITGGPGVMVNNGTPSSPYINMGMPSAGMMRYNGSSQTIEIYDGTSWMTMATGYATVQLDSSAMSVIEWARNKMAEEEERKRLAQSSPAINDLLKQIEEKEEQIKIVQTLLREEVKVGTN